MSTGYGDGRVTIGPTMVGRVAVTNATAVPALTPRIRFGLSWTLGHLVHTGDRSLQQKYQLVDFGGELRLGTDDRFIGQLVRDGAGYPLRSFDYVDTQGGAVALDLDRYQLEQLEECPAGGVLTVKMQLWPRIEIDGVTTNAQVEEIRFQIPRDDWLETVRTITGEQVDVLEIRYHLMYADRYGPSLTELGRAQRAVERGDFDYAVLRARKAVGLMEKSVKATTGNDLESALTDTIDKRHANLYGGVIARAKRMGNIAAHQAEARQYTRAEALFTIRLATISLEVVAALLPE